MSDWEGDENFEEENIQQHDEPDEHYGYFHYDGESQISLGLENIKYKGCDHRPCQHVARCIASEEYKDNYGYLEQKEGESFEKTQNRSLHERLRKQDKQIRLLKYEVSMLRRKRYFLHAKDTFATIQPSFIAAFDTFVDRTKEFIDCNVTRSEFVVSQNQGMFDEDDKNYLWCEEVGKEEDPYSEEHDAGILELFECNNQNLSIYEDYNNYVIFKHVFTYRCNECCEEHTNVQWFLCYFRHDRTTYYLTHCGTRFGREGISAGFENIYTEFKNVCYNCRYLDLIRERYPKIGKDKDIQLRITDKFVWKGSRNYNIYSRLRSPHSFVYNQDYMSDSEMSEVSGLVIQVVYNSKVIVQILNLQERHTSRPFQIWLNGLFEAFELDIELQEDRRNSTIPMAAFCIERNSAKIGSHFPKELFEMIGKITLNDNRPVAKVKLDEDNRWNLRTIKLYDTTSGYRYPGNSTSLVKYVDENMVDIGI